MAHFLAQNWLLNRRHVLRGLGVSLALPLLDCMRTLRAAETAPRAKRSVFIYLPNGVNTTAYEMPTAGADYKLSKPLASLEKHRKVITPIINKGYDAIVGLIRKKAPGLGKKLTTSGENEAGVQAEPTF